MLIYSDTTGLTCHMTCCDFSFRNSLYENGNMVKFHIFTKTSSPTRISNAIKSSFIRNFRMHSTFIEESNIQVTCYFWNFQSEFLQKMNRTSDIYVRNASGFLNRVKLTSHSDFSLDLPIKKKQSIWSQFIDKKFTIQIM